MARVMSFVARHGEFVDDVLLFQISILNNRVGALIHTIMLWYVTCQYDILPNTGPWIPDARSALCVVILAFTALLGLRKKINPPPVT